MYIYEFICINSYIYTYCTYIIYVKYIIHIYYIHTISVLPVAFIWAVVILDKLNIYKTYWVFVLWQITDPIYIK